MKHHPRTGVRATYGLVSSVAAAALLLSGTPAHGVTASLPAAASPASAAPTDAPSTPPTLLPKDGAYLEGTVTIASDATVAGDDVVQLALDGTPLEATPTLGVSRLSFDVGSNSIETRFRNYLVVNGGEPIYLTDAVNERVTVEVDNDQLREGANTVEFFTGGIDSSCGLNHDDFDLSDIRLETLAETADGEENEFSYAFGDGSCGTNTARTTHAELQFNLAQEPGATTGLTAELDTTTVANGRHQITATTASGASVTHSVRINNAPPGAPRVTPTDGTLVAGEQTVIAALPTNQTGTVDSLTIDGAPAAGRLSLAQGTATFAFDVGSNSIDVRYFNYLLVNGHHVDIGGDWVDERVEVRVPHRFLVPGENVIRVVTGDLNSGSGATLCANRDDFDMSGVGLAVDGATVTPTDVAASYAIGDGTCGSSTTRLPEVDLRFDIAGAATTTQQVTTATGQASLSFFVGGNGTEARYGNHVLVNGMRHEIGDVVGETTTLTFPNEWLHPGVNVVEFVAGSISTSCGENFDDFTVSDYVLEPAAGTATVLHKSVRGDGSTQALAFGDGNCGSTHTPTLHTGIAFEVQAPAAGLRADVDTAALADGEHDVASTSSGDKTARRVLITDNTGPVVATSVPAEGQRLLSAVALDLQLDDLAGVSGDPEITLDGEPVALGDPVGPGLEPGEHSLVVRATDALGNTATRTVRFTSAGIPDVPTDLAPVDGTTGVDESVDLSAVVSVPGGGEVTATFSEAEIVSPARGFQGTATAVPTTLEVAGEEQVDTGSLAPLAGGELASPSGRDVVFQRFDLPVAGRDGAPVLRWEGVIDPERTVALRAWNTATGAWDVLASARGAVEGDTTLTTRVGNAHLDEGTVHVMVTGEDPFADDIEPGDPNGFADPASYDFSIAHFTDTQYLSEGAVEQETEAEREIWKRAYGATTEWLAAEAGERKISYVAHTGDIIENNYNAPTTPEMEAQVRGEFEVSSEVQGTLDAAGIPNQVIAGNHDNQLGRETGPDSLYNQWYGPERYDAIDETWADASYGGPWKEGDNQNNYVLFSAGGLEFVVVGLSYGVTKEEAAWADSIFKRYSDRNGILLSHDYIKPSTNPDGRGSQFAAPDGSLLYKLLVEPNPNVFLILAGHEHGVGTNLKRGVGATVTHDVVEMLADYQFYTVRADRLGLTEVGGYAPSDRLRFGASFLRLLQFDVDRGEMIVDTYSPFLDEFGATEYDEDNRYDGTEDNMVLPVDLTSRTTTFTSHSLAVYLPQEEIGTDTVASGEAAQVTWSGLDAETTYAWVVSATSPGGGRAVAEPGVFATGEADAPVLAADDVTVGYGEEAEVVVTVDGGEREVRGTVTLRDGERTIDTVDVVDGVARLQLAPGLAPGEHTLTAAYSGGGFLAAAEAPVTVVVEPGTALVTATADAVVEGTAPVVDVLVDGAGIEVSGTVEVREGTQVLGTGVLADGRASVRLPSDLPVGTHRLVVAYSGNDGLEPAEAELTLRVKPGSGPVQPGKAKSKVAAKVVGKAKHGKKFAVRARVTVTGGQRPTGRVVVSYRGRQLAARAVNGKGWLVLRTNRGLAKGVRVLTVSYRGTATIAPSSTKVRVKVQPKGRPRR